MVRHLQIIITGKVENTGFRLYALRGAVQMNISGNVKQIEGKVFIEAEGEHANIEGFIEWCRKGPQGDKVQNVISSEKKIAGYTDFKIL